MKKKIISDKQLGMVSPITRRDFLNATLIGAGGALLSSSVPLLTSCQPEKIPQKDAWSGYGAVGDYAQASGNAQEVVAVAHRMRDGFYDKPNLAIVDTGESYDMVVVGGGISGLGAAHFFKKEAAPDQKCLILENHAIFGGVAKGNEFVVDGQRIMGPQGSNDFGVPALGTDSIPAKLYEELGIPRAFEFQEWPSGVKPLKVPMDNYAHMTGFAESLVDIGYYFPKGEQGLKEATWYKNIWQDDLKNSPYSEQVRKDLLAWRYYNYTGPRDESFLRKLDSMTYKTYLEQELGFSPEVTRYTDPVVGLINGASADAVSAFAANQIGLPGGRPYQGGKGSLNYSFPIGNGTFARYLVKSLIPESIRGGESLDDISNQAVRFEELDRAGRRIRLRVGAMVIRVEHDGDPEKAEYVKICYEREGKVYQVKAKSVVMASAGEINKHIVKDLPASYQEAYSQFTHAPALVVNVALTNWRFLYKMGVTAAQWFGEGFGFSANIRRPMRIGNYRPPLDPDKPTVLTFYTGVYTPGMPLRQQNMQARMKILGTSFYDYERLIREQMLEQFGSYGFDPQKDIAGMILNRWGHARVVQPPGFYFGLNGQKAPREIVSEPYGRIAIGHSELNGHQSWTGAVTQGYRAAGEALKRV